MPSELLKRARSQRQLERAWRVVESNGRGSTSETVRSEIEAYAQDSAANLRSLNRRLQRGSYKFPAARGIAIPKSKAGGKKDKSKIRPIVLGTVEARLVQRALLEVLSSVEELRPYFLNPYSFGGIRKQKDAELAAVPAAVSEVLKSVAAGAQFVACADISGFFTKIPKGLVLQIISKAVDDLEFMEFLEQAIQVELSNLAELRRYAADFPTGEIGVAQGNSLSPLLGNIILHDFDRVMNEGDCRCIRYIDDFIILGPTASAVATRLRRGRKVLTALDMSLAAEKTDAEPKGIATKFEFLGIEFSTGLLRPAKKARSRLIESLRETFLASASAFQTAEGGAEFARSLSFVQTLRRADAVLQGWGKHYRFCNDLRCLQNLDREIDELIGAYIGRYAVARRATPDARKRALLGVQALGDLELRSFIWPVSGAPDEPMTSPVIQDAESPEEFASLDSANDAPWD